FPMEGSGESCGSEGVNRVVDGRTMSQGQSVEFPGVVGCNNSSISSNSSSSASNNKPYSNGPTHTDKVNKTNIDGGDKLLAGDRWSQEENSSVVHDVIGGNSSAVSISLTNGYHRPSSADITLSHSTKSLELKNDKHSLLNNNLIEDKCNLRSADEKPYCLYHKFPTKVNNNIYPEKASVKDGMEEYFRMNASVSLMNGGASPCSTADKRNELSPSNEGQHPSDQLNLLNGEDDDEDEGCIYTLKGEMFEDNLSHLIDMCLSCGLPNIERNSEARGQLMQRLLNGSNRPNPIQQNNLFSPEMDFLEMDFDPGPSGDGELDSDSDDNCIHVCDSRLVNREENAFYVNNGALNPKNVLDKKPNIQYPEMRNMMCRRCESSLSDGDEKIDNVALNMSVRENNSIYNLENDPGIDLDDRPELEKPSILNVPRDSGLKSSKDLNVHLNFVSCTSNSINHHINKEGVLRLHNDDYDVGTDNDSVENNLGDNDLLDIIDMDYGEEADDEDGDDSNSECHHSSARGSFSHTIGDAVGVNSGSSRDNMEPTDNRWKDGTASNSSNTKWQDSRGAESSLILNHKDDACKTTTTANNNLGSVSAPEVSPAKEYSPLEKFGRSVSFHNQLSSPKYENVCFPIKPKTDEGSNVSVSCPAPAECKKHQADSANLEACSGRLHRRENLFNILSEPIVSNGDECEWYIDKNCTSASHIPDIAVVTRLSNSDSPSRVPLAAATSSHSLFSGGVPPMIPSLLSNGTSCPLFVKSLRPKNSNPTQDPNTASEGCVGGDDSCPRVKKIMIWTELQATARQVTQIGTSACGATAIINVLLALDFPYTVEEVQSSVKTRLRAETAQVVEYLLSRSVAGATHQDLIDGVTHVTRGEVKAKFFHMFPKRAFQLSRWLAEWISKGGVPVATLNLQVGVAPGQTTPDAWHHQMIFGVGPQGIYLTNPLECVSDCLLADQLSTDSVLLVRRVDIVQRWGRGDKLVNLIKHDDTRWRDMNVLGK
ncbi:unnamed protein product, partial [Meganyctiphanes norvegica]